MRAAFCDSIRGPSDGSNTRCPNPIRTIEEHGSIIRQIRLASGTSITTDTSCASSHWNERQRGEFHERSQSTKFPEVPCFAGFHAGGYFREALSYRHPPSFLSGSFGRRSQGTASASARKYNLDAGQIHRGYGPRKRRGIRDLDPPSGVMVR